MEKAPILPEYKFHMRLILLLLMLAAAFCATPAEFLPVVTNYSARQYDAQLQNWDATQLPSGVMCFANGDGVLTFDGYTWQKYRLPVNYIVRSVFADNDRLYVGSFEEFGYFTRTKTGAFSYTSLSSRLKNKTFRNDEFWNILKIGNTIYFQSFEKIYSYDGSTGKVSTLPSKFEKGTERMNFRPLYIFNHRGRLIAQNIGGGLCALGDKGWVEITAPEEAWSYVVAIIGDIALTENNGLKKIGSDGHLTPYPTAIDHELTKYKANRAVINKRGHIIIGTIGGGVYALSAKGELQWHISTVNGGMCNNSVLGLFNDARDNLWVCLDDGISLIHTGEPYTMLQPEAGQNDIGMVYGIGRDKSGDLIIAANQGAYRYGHNTGGAFRLIPGTIGQNWCARRFDDQMFIGNNDNTFEIGHNQELTPVSGTATDMKKGVIQGQEVIVQSSYYEFYIYTRRNGRWGRHAALYGFGAPVRQIEIASDGTIWATHMTRGVIRARINPALDTFTDVKTFESLGADSVPRMCNILNIRGEILFTDDHHIYTYNEADDRFEINSTAEKDLHWIKAPRSATRVDDNRFWLATAEACHLVEFHRGGYKSLYTIPLDIFPRAANNLISAVYPDSDRYAYFNLNGGIGRIDMDEACMAPDNDFEPALEIITAKCQLTSGGSTDISLDYSDKLPETHENNIHFLLSYPAFGHTPLRYRFRLEGSARKLDSIATIPQISYPRLDPGKYTLTAEVLDENSQVLDRLEYRFNVPRPWHMQWWAFLIYILLAFGIIWALMRFYTRRRLAEVRRKLADERTRHNTEIHKQQLVIAEQQKQILEKELTEKGKELASMALDAYSRQQVIDQLRESLNDSRGKGISNAGTVKALSQRLQELSTREGGGGEFWSMFEQNFDLIHEHFFRNLRRQFPALTSGDLRLCVLIRMNLSTKDIARFQGLTVRGVETARYRLRKKLGLPSESNINEFLIDFGDKE